MITIADRRAIAAQSVLDPAFRDQLMADSKVAVQLIEAECLRSGLRV